MSPLSSLRLRRVLLAFGIAILLLRSFASPAQAVPDANATKQIWGHKYGVTPTQLADTNWASQDADGDGVTNGSEIVAGTNPFNPTKTIKVSSIAKNGSAVELQFPTESGKRYRVESTSNLTGSWVLQPQPTPVQAIGNGSLTPMMLSVPYVANHFYRVRVDDIDGDNDGVGDWAEMAVGLNPAVREEIEGKTTILYVNEQIALPNVVTIVPSTPFASEDGPTAGRMTVTRTQNLFPITVNYTIGGTAVPVTDYTPLAGSVGMAGSVLFPGRGAKTMDLFVNPVAPQPAIEGSKSVTTALVPPGAVAFPFTLGAQNTATVIINDSTAPAGTGLLARYYDTSSTNQIDAANFGQFGTYLFTRGAPTTTGSIVVTPANPAHFAGLQIGNQVKLTFTSGNGAIDNATFDHQNYNVTAVGATSFTVAITSASAFSIGTTNGNCTFSIQSFPPIATVTRVDPMVNFDWAYGTPNDVSLTPATVVDNYSTVYEGYLSPTTAGGYRFQLDADDKARVLVDLNNNGTFDLPGEQVVEHGWDTIDGISTPEVVGTFKIGTSKALVVPAGAAQRYQIRIEQVETTNSARCRVQWSRDGGTFANIPSTNLFTRATASTYAASGGTVTVTTPTAHNLVAGTDSATLWFSAGALFGQATNYSGIYLVSTTPSTTTFTVTIAGAPTQATGAAVQWGNSASTTAGMIQSVYANTSFSGGAGSVSVQAAGPNQNNNGIFGAGTPDSTLIAKDTFSARWTGQVQPQFTEEYTFIVHADDSFKLWLNGRLQEMKPVSGTSQGGSTYSYSAGTGATTITYTNSAIKPNSFAVGETVRLDPSSGALPYQTGSTYTYDGVTGLAVINYSNLTGVVPGSFAVGETVFLDPTAGTLTSLGSLPYLVTASDATTFTVNFGTGTFPSQTTAATLNISDNADRVITAVTANSFTVNFGAGKYADLSAGNINIEIVNKPLYDWFALTNAPERFVRIPLVGGARYDIQLDYFEGTGYSRCALYWYSPSQTKQIIPRERLYPSNATPAPPVHISPTVATALVGGSFSHPIAGSNGATVTFIGPGWLSYSNGVISGTPPPGSGGDYQVLITITNAAGTSTSVLNLHVENAGGTITRDYWNSVTGTTVASIPTTTNPTGTGTLTSLEAVTNSGNNYGARIRGYITAPTSGNYYFWIAANNAAELWISNDDEPVNAHKRAWVTTGNSTPQTWNDSLTQKSPWIALEQGQRYYVEILHKAGSSTQGGDNLAVGWSKPGEPTDAPSQVVPGYVLSPWAPLVPLTPGSIFSATLRPQGSVVTNGSGTSNIRLNTAETEAIITINYSNLTSAYVGMHVHDDIFPAGSGLGNIICDLDEPGDVERLPDGTFKWIIEPINGRSVANLVADLKAGIVYFNVHSANNPNGEIKGYYSKLEGSQTFTAPAAPPAWTNDITNDAQASRFLTQATFGPNTADIAALQAALTYDAWITAQFGLAKTYTLPEVIRTEQANASGGAYDETLVFNSWWRNAITAPDQLRQRVAFALSEIHVVSAQGPLDNRAEAIAAFYDMLVDHAFGNFRDLLEATTKTWTMGRYLDMWRNDKPDLGIGRSPNENYAREIMQLFSVGLYRMWPDGSIILNSKFAPIETYTQREIVGLAHAFTGWDYNYAGSYRTTLGAAARTMEPMREVPARHFTGPKRILNNEVLPGLPTVGGQPLDPYATHNTTHFGDPAYQALAEKEIDATHDQLFNHPNVGPFICRQLIQRLVTSHPSKDYVYRVVQKFNDNGSGIRGDMQAVIKAILLDYEARSAAKLTDATFGKQREPVLRVTTAARAFRPATFSGTYTQTEANNRVITINTTTPHKLLDGNDVFLEFTSGSPAPFIGTYTNVDVVDTDSFTVNAPGWATGTYNIPANQTTCTVTMSNHWLQVGHQIFVDFTSGTASGVANLDKKVYTLLTASAEAGTNGTFTFAITSGTTGSTRSGNVMIPRFSPGSYVVTTLNAADQSANPGKTHRITLDTNTDHHLNVGNQVQLNFYAGNPQPPDFVGTVERVVDLNTYTVLASNLLGTDSDEEVYQFPLLSQPLVRSGNVGSRPSTFALGRTDTEIDQSPLNSPTVFNFYLPDYKFPGPLAQAGLTTPEFQETAETSVIRQANFLERGIYELPNTNNGLSSFRATNGTLALAMDLTPWTANATGPNGPAGTIGFVLGAGSNETHPWTHNANLSVLIDRLSTLFLGTTLPATVKTAITTFVQTRADMGAAYNQTTNPYTNIPYNNSGASTASDAEKRNRIRAIVHLILTSPDFTIQR